MKQIVAIADSSELVACKAISNGALASESLPHEIKLLNWGVNQTTKGDVIVDDTTAAALSVNQRSLGFDRIALDFEHNTVEGSPEYDRTKEPRDVAGYGVPKLVKGDGLYLSAIEYTPIGKEKARNFADLSPTPLLDKNRRVIFLHSVALVRNGAVHDLSFFSAATGGTPKTETAMTPEQIQALIANALTAAVKPLNDQILALTGEIKTLKETKPAEPVITLSVADGKTATMTLAQLGAEFVALKADTLAAKAAQENAEKANVIALFAKDGKVPMGEDNKPMSEDKLKELTVGTLKMLHASTPVTVPLSARGKTPGNDKDAPKGMDAVRAAIRADLAPRA